MTIRDRIISFIISLILAIGLYMIATSAMGNNFPVPVLAESLSGVAGPIAIKLHFEKCGHEARGSTMNRNPETGRTLAAGDSFRSGVLPTLASGAFLAHAPRLASTARTPADSFLDAIERVESNGNANAIGDGGKARGSMQFWRVAWCETSAARKRAGRPVFTYESGATNRAIARSYAESYLGKLNTYLTTALKRTPTHTELYCAWNLGPSGFKRRGFSLSRCPASTQKAAVKINSMLALSKGGAASKGRMHNVASVAVARR